MKYLAVLIWCALGFPFSVNAQLTDTIRKWSLEDCFQYAFENNIDINTARLNLLSSNQDVKLAKGSRIPSLNGNLDNTFSNTKTQVSTTGKFENQLITAGNYSLNSSLVLWNGNFIRNNIHQKELVSKTYSLMVDQSKNNIILQITQAYLAILLAKENLVYITDVVSTSENRLTQGEQLYAAGSTARISVLQLQAQLSSDQYLKLQTENTIRQDILALKQLLQLPSTVAFDIKAPTNLKVVPLVSSLQTVQKHAFETFPEIKIGQLDKDISSLTISKARAGFLPTLTANAIVATGYNDVFRHPVNPKYSYFTQTGNNLYEQIGFTLSIPLFSNFTNSTNLEKAKIGYRQSDFNLKNTALILSQQIELAYLNATNSQEAFQVANQQLISVTESYRILSEEYKLGGINAFDLLQQKNQYIQAVQAFTQSKYTAILAQKTFDFYNGSKIQL